ncbi:uncharacterized protein AKAME5_001959900 [Lates japonicus]|uniref:Uncharacterized protein n=1 Tax=Lates japonicus TaxID=270547 RepID=A0AAD3NAG5_LATJO|nr:uncharacterized protein AKAME5_001959900 [Lates japonicus]
MQTNPWWRLLLPGIYRITAVSVTNRMEVPERINNAEIRIGNSAENNGNNNPSQEEQMELEQVLSNISFPSPAPVAGTALGYCQRTRSV